MCHMKYDVIGKVETADEDAKYAFYKTGLDLPIKDRTHVSHGGSSDDLALSLFSTISLDKRKQLYEMYKLDFLMFDYSVEGFYEV